MITKDIIISDNIHSAMLPDLDGYLLHAWCPQGSCRFVFNELASIFPPSATSPATSSGMPSARPTTPRRPAEQFPGVKNDVTEGRVSQIVREIF